jgi:predicted anti-sigma-YlaC factor YlaD
MTSVLPSLVCRRVREQVSLQLDNELSELERRMLDAHLARCAECDAYADDVRTFTRDLREAPLLAPGRTVDIARRGRYVAARLQIGVAAALAFAALGLGTQLAASTESGDTSLSRFEGSPNLSPPRSVLEREQAILQVVKPGTPLPRPGSVL